MKPLQNPLAGALVALLAAWPHGQTDDTPNPATHAAPPTLVCDIGGQSLELAKIENGRAWLREGAALAPAPGHGGVWRLTGGPAAWAARVS